MLCRRAVHIKHVFSSLLCSWEIAWMYCSAQESCKKIYSHLCSSFLTRRKLETSIKTTRTSKSPLLIIQHHDPVVGWLEAENKPFVTHKYFPEERNTIRTGQIFQEKISNFPKSKKSFSDREKLSRILSLVDYFSYNFSIIYY